MEDIFRFKQFEIRQNDSAMKVGTDGVLLGAWADVGGVTTALDIGTGTGLIALMLAQRGVRQVTAVEIDHAAADEAKANVASSPWPDVVEVIESDFLSLEPPHLYGLIVTNPPFFSETLLSPDLRRAAARSATTLPLDKLMAHASQWLAPEGRMAIVLPCNRVDELTYAAALNRLHISRLCMVAHHEGKAPRRTLAELSPAPQPTVRTSLFIQSQQYTELTNEFYL